MAPPFQKLTPRVNKKGSSASPSTKRPRQFWRIEKKKKSIPTSGGGSLHLSSFAMARTVKRPRPEPQAFHQLGVRGRYVPLWWWKNTAQNDAAKVTGKSNALTRWPLEKPVLYYKMEANETSMACNRSNPSSPRTRKSPRAEESMKARMARAAAKWKSHPVSVGKFAAGPAERSG